MKRTAGRKRTVATAAGVGEAWSAGLVVRAEGAGTVAHAGVVLPRLLADRVGMTGVFREVLARPGFLPGRDRGRAVSDTVAALASGASCLTGVEALTAQVELFGPNGGASDTTIATNTTTGQVQYLDARHRTQAHVEDRIKELKACGAAGAPSTSYPRNSAWLHLAAHAVTVLSWLRLLALDDDLALAEPRTLRFRLLAAPARYVRHARARVLKIPTGWAWATHLADAFDRLRALHPA